MNFRIKLSRNAEHGNPERNPISSGQNGAAGRVWWWRSRERNARRGVTLIEAVLFISVALSLIVGWLQVYKQVQMAARVQAQVRALSAIMSEIRVLYQNTLVVDGLPWTIDEVLAVSGAVPKHLIKPLPWNKNRDNVLRTEWGARAPFDLGIAHEGGR